MASGVLASMTDAVPLLNADGTGRNNARDIRVGLLTPVVGVSGGSVTPRAGVQGTRWSSANSRWEDLFVRADATATKNVIVQYGQAFVARTGQGAYSAWTEADITVTLSDSDGTNPRIDLICARVGDQRVNAGDPTHGAVIWVEEGTPSGTPAVPATPAGSIVLAQVARAAGATGNQLVQGNITDKRTSSSVRGATRALMPADTLAEAGGYHGERRLRTGTAFVAAGLPATTLVDAWDATASKWRGTNVLCFAEPTPTVLEPANRLGGATTHTWASVSIPDPGWPYYIEAEGSVLIGIDPSATTTLSGVYVQLNYDSTSFTATANIIHRGYAVTAPYPNQSRSHGRTGVLTGARTVYMLIRNDSSPSNFLVAGNNEYYSFNVKAIPAATG